MTLSLMAVNASAEESKLVYPRHPSSTSGNPSKTTRQSLYVVRKITQGNHIYETVRSTAFTPVVQDTVCLAMYSMSIKRGRWLPLTSQCLVKCCVHSERPNNIVLPAS